MNTSINLFRPDLIKLYIPAFKAVLFVCALHVCNIEAATTLADQPVLATGSSSPGNVALTLSVEYPTALGTAYTSTAYSSSQEFLGYFDANKCYRYDMSLGLYNTGVDDSNNLLVAGTLDPHWRVTSVSPANASFGTGVMDVVRDNLYLGNTSTAKSIGLQSSPPQNTNYTYQTSFFIPASVDVSNMVVSFTLAHDDNLISISVNNATQTNYASGGFSFGDAITLRQGTNNNVSFVAGATNTITIVIYNNTGEAGIRIDNMTITSGSTTLRSDGDGNYFKPISAASNHTCSGLWSGNFLNWALTQTIDPFRSVLTGGYRGVDRVGSTVLEKAWHSGQNSTADQILTGSSVVSNATPYNFSALKVRINGLGTQLYFTGTGNNYSYGYSQATTTGFARDKNIPLPQSASSSNVYQMYARVKACDPVAGLESNCTAYGTNYKPEGLIQSNAKKLNFAAFGYLYENNIYRDGGVLRAKMAALGPVKSAPNAYDVTNPNPEWDGNTGIFFINPDPADATATGNGVTNSGVINYLNKFGLTAPGYKTYDPVSELYYAAIRYFKNQGNVASYTSNINSTTADGFPVITSWNDPIQYSCQSNFIIGIGDTNTHADANLPGTTIRGGYEPALPSEVSADFADLRTTSNPNGRGIDVTAATNKVGQLEGLGNLGTTYTPCCTNATFFMAGLAYDSHTVDMRPDITGNQTVTTYWLDVLEGGFRAKNQFWLAAKYGGFTVPNGYSPYAANAVAPAIGQWDTDNNGDPDNYFRANDPGRMITGLKNAFNSILSVSTGSSTAFALASPTIRTGSLSYATAYDSNGWVGEVSANRITISTSGAISTSNVWNASDELATQLAGSGWSTSRFIATSKCSGGSAGTQSCTGANFRWTDLNTTQQNALGSNTSNQQNVLNYLRGERANEGAVYRIRRKLLGDIINSKVVPVGPPNAGYSDSFNPGYSAFVNANLNRKVVAYVGSNDGMLHAFDGTDDATTGGNELFAYVPNALFNGPNNTPNIDGLAALSNISYVHRNYVDATPQISDVNFGANASDWHTLLVSGLGKGGKSYFAIDVTNPANLSNEANLKAAVKWEFTHTNMGYTYDTPLIIKVPSTSWIFNTTSPRPATDQWVVVLTSGYNNSDGKGYFFFVKPSDGTLIRQVSTGVGSTSNDAGLAHVNAFVANGSSGLADAIYAGDLLGNVWRVDLINSTDQTPLQLAQLTANDDLTAQPVTTSPIIETDTNTGKRYVFVATGRLLDPTDLNITQKQTFYAINDGTFNQFYTSSTLPSTPGSGQVRFPITRSKLVNDSDLVAGPVADPNKPMGYYIELGIDSSNNEPYFVNVEMASAAGAITFVANKVDSSNSCKPIGSNSTYSISYDGRSVLTSNGSSVVKIDGVGLGVNITLFQMVYVDANGNTVRTGTGGMTCSDSGCSNFGQTPTSKPFKQLNWRELPTAE